MRREAFRTVKPIVDWRLCLGCGACAYICPAEKIHLVDVASEGIRPIVADEECGGCRDCLRVCPAYENDHRHLSSRPGLLTEFTAAYGPVLEVWDAYATDPEIRWKGSSGGLLTALGLYCLEREGMHAVLQIAADPLDPVRNRTRLSRTRDELISATGSRYAPASACDSLGLVEAAPAPCVFVGQPSEVTALRKAETLRPALASKVGLRLSFFCAGTPGSLGTSQLLRDEGFHPTDVAELRYRGMGWPGSFAVRRRDEGGYSPVRSYEDSWAFLQRFRPFSVHLTPDGTGEDADISCGDAWHRKPRSGLEQRAAGVSLVLARTDRGCELLRRAERAGYVSLEPVDVADALQAQINLTRKRGAVWGRTVTLRLLGLPAPRLRGFYLFRNWMKLSLLEKIQSTLGTARRAIQRNYYRRIRMAQLNASPAFDSLRSAAGRRHAPPRENAIVQE